MPSWSGTAPSTSIHTVLPLRISTVDVSRKSIPLNLRIAGSVPTFNKGLGAWKSLAGHKKEEV